MREGIIDFWHAGFYTEDDLQLFVDAKYISEQDKSDLLAGKL